jgi:hypothetical protein
MHYTHYSTRKMKRVIHILLFIYLLAIYPGFLTAQSTFEFVLEYPVRKSSRMAIEAENGDLIAIVSERTGVDYAPNSPTRSYLLRFTPQGDTTTYHYTFGDTLFNFSLIDRAYNGGYLLAGNALTPDSAQLFLILVRMDSDLNKVWVKYHDMTSYWFVSIRRVFHLNNKYLIALEPADQWPLPLVYHQLTWFDTLGNLGNYYQHEHKTHGSSDYLLNSDSTRIWAFSPTYKGDNNWPARLVFDTTPQFISHSIRPYGDWYTNVLWHTDSTFLLSASALRPDYAGSHDRDMWIISYDSMLNVIHSNYFGAYDTLVKTGTSRNIDFRHPDTVFFAGWKHQCIGKPPPGRVSWIMTGQTDAQLQPRYLHFIGGDYYYETHYILATKDGGSFICASRFNHNTQVYDPVFLKLNSEGMLVGTNKETIPLKKTAFWPNPFSEGLHYQTLQTGSQFLLFDITGKEMFSTTIHSTSGHIQTGKLPPGSYIYELRYTTGAIETGKLIKSQ